MNSTGRIRSLIFSVDKPLHESIEAYAESAHLDTHELMCDAFVTNIKRLELEPLRPIDSEDPYHLEMYLASIETHTKKYRWGLRCSEQMMQHIDRICVDQEIGIIGLFRQSATRYSSNIILSASFAEDRPDDSM